MNNKPGRLFDQVMSTDPKDAKKYIDERNGKQPKKVDPPNDDEFTQAEFNELADEYHNKLGG